MDLQECEDAKKKVAEFLRDFEVPAPLSQISRYISCPQETAIFVIAEMISEGTVRENRPEMTYLRLTGETTTYSLV